MRGLSLGLRLSSSKRDCNAATTAPEHHNNGCGVSNKSLSSITSSSSSPPQQQQHASQSKIYSRESSSCETSPSSAMIICSLQDQLAKTKQELATHKQFMKDVANVGIELESSINSIITSRQQQQNQLQQQRQQPLLLTWRRPEDIRSDENDNGYCTNLILNNLKSLVQPLQERIHNVETSNKDLKLAMLHLEKQHRHATTKLKQDIRIANNEKWLKENE